MTKAARYFLFGFMVMALGATFAQAAWADTELNKVQHLDDTLVLPGADTAVARTYHQAVAFSIRSTAGDSIQSLTVTIKKRSGNAFMDSITIYRDVNKNGGYDSGVDAVAFYLPGTDTGASQMSLQGGNNFVLTGLDSFVAVPHFNSSMQTGDTVVFIFERNGLPGVSVLNALQPGGYGVVGIPSLLLGTQTSLEFRARIDTTNVTVTNLGDRFIHPDSRANLNPFTIFSGTIHGETRGLMRDRLRNVGVAFGGTASDSVAEAWILLGGRAADTINLTKVAADSWNANWVDSSMPLNGIETFIVRVRMAETTAIPSTIWAYAPRDSYRTEIRPAGPVANAGNSGIFTITKQNVILNTVNLGPVTRHPDSQAVDGPLGTLAASGLIMADTFTGITNDIVEAFGVSLVLGGGVVAANIESVAVEINGDTRTMTKVGALDSWSVILNKAITDTASYKIYVRVHGNTPNNGTVLALIMTDSITTSMRSGGPKSVATSNRLITYTRPDLILAIENLGAIRAHADSQTGDALRGVLAARGRILADTVTGVTVDSMVSVGVNLAFGGGMAAAHVDSVAIVLNAETIAMVRDGATDTWFANVNRNFWGGETYEVYVRAHDNTPSLGTVEIRISQDSTITRFRNVGPESIAFPGRTITYLKPNVFLVPTALGNASSHPDSLVAYGKLGILVASGSLAQDTQTRITGDVLGAAGVGFVFGGGMTAANIDSVAIEIDGDTRLMARVGATDSWGVFLNKAITDTANYKIYVRAHSNTPTGGTLVALISVDSFGTRFRDSGPRVPIFSGRVVTYEKQNVILNPVNLGNASSHPDSQVAYGKLGILAARGVLMADTFTGITADNVRQFGVSLVFGGGMTSAHVDSVAVEINGDTRILTKDVVDSWFVALTKGITDTAEYRVYVRAHSNTPTGGNVTILVMPDSVTTDYRNPGPKSVITSNRTITFEKQNVILTADALASATINPDSRAMGESLGILALSASLNADSFTGITNDNLTLFGVSLVFGGGMVAADVESVAIEINGDTRIMARDGVLDSWFVAPAKAITDTAYLKVYVRVRKTTPDNGTVSARINVDSIVTSFRNPGPKDAITSGRVVTCITPTPEYTADVLGNLTVNPDSQVTGGVIGTLVASGVVAKDTISGLPNDISETFGVSLILAGLTSANIESVALVINEDTRPMAREAGRDSWFANFAKTIADTLYYRVYVRAHDNTPSNSTLTARIMVDSVALRYRDVSPSAVISSGRIITYDKQDVILAPDALANISIHPDPRVSTSPVGVLMTSGVLVADTFSGISADQLETVGVSLILTGLTAASIDSVSFEVNGDTRTMTKEAARDSWFVRLAKAITDTAQYRVYVRTNPLAVSGATIRAWIMNDSIGTLRRDSGPKAAATSGRVVTLDRQDVSLKLTTLASVTLNPDSRSMGESLGVLVASGQIEADTQSAITNDTIQYLGVALIFSGGMTANNVESVAIEVNGDTRVATRLGTTDSWILAGLNKLVTDTINVRVYVRAAKSTPDSGALSVALITDSIWTELRDSGPNATLPASCTVTYFTPDPMFLPASLGNLTVHPDSRVNGGVIGVLVASGSIEKDTISGLTADVMETFGVSLILNGMTSAHVESVALVLNEDTRPMTREAGRDSWFINFTKSVTDTVNYRVYVRSWNTVNSGSTCSALVMIDSVTLRYRDPGPKVVIASNRTVTFDRQDVILSMEALPDTQNHPDSRIWGGPHGTLVCSGVLTSDSFSGITNDVIQSFGVSLILTGGIAASHLESVVVVINNDTRALTRVGTADSWQATVNKSITDTAFLQVWVRMHDNTPLGGTITARIQPESIVTQFRDSGPKSVATSGRILTCTKPILRLHMNLIGQNGQDTILPAYAISNKVIICSGVIGLDTSLLPGDTDILTGITAQFGGTAGDSVYNAQFSVKATGAWNNLTLDTTNGYRWAHAALSIQVATGDTFAFRINFADTATLGTLFWCSFVQQGCTATYSTNGPGVRGTARDTSADIMVSADPIVIVMDQLSDTTIPPWNMLLSNPIKVCTGHMFINIGPTPMLPYDTLTNFGLNFDTKTNDIIVNDAIETVALYLTPSPIRPSGDTRYLVRDSAVSYGLWKLHPINDSRVLMSETQGFEIWVTVKSYFRDSRIIIGDSFFVRIPKDSVNTIFTSGLAGETSSGRTVNFFYPDTLDIKQDITLTDTNVNPDSTSGDVPFTIFRGRINGRNGSRYTGVLGDSGQQYYAAARDSVTYFSIAFYSAATSDVTVADSIVAASVYFGPGEESFALTAGPSYTDAFGARVKPFFTATRLNRLMSDTATNSETFVVRGWVYETVALGANSRVRAFMHADSVQTFFMGDSLASQIIMGQRIVTFTKVSFVISAQQLSDTAVSMFRAQNDSTLVFAGRFAACKDPVDSLVTFGIRITGTTGLRRDSFVVIARLDSGIHTPGGETQMIYVNAVGSDTLEYRLQGRVTIETGQTFSIFVVNTDTAPFESPVLGLKGRNITAIIGHDSATASLAAGPQGNISCSRTVYYNYMDTVLITNVSHLDTFVHPDSRLRQNPFLAWEGALRGQISRTGLADTLQRLGVRFTGTASDSIVAVQLAVKVGAGATDTLNLVKGESAAWISAALDSQVAYNNLVSCSLYVRIAETVALGSTLRATVNPDSISFFYCADTTLFTASRTATFEKPTLSVNMTALGDTLIPMFAQLGSNPVLLCSGVLSLNGASMNVTTDTLSRFGIVFDTVSTDIRTYDAIKEINVHLLPSAARLAGETVPLIKDTSNPSLLWKAPGETVLPETQVFLIYVTLADTFTPYFTRVFEGDLFFGRIAKDSVFTHLTKGTVGETSSQRIVRFFYPDTTRLTLDTMLSITVHPDTDLGQNPFTIIAGKVYGQLYRLTAGDSLRQIAITFGGGAADSVTAAKITFAGSDTVSLVRNGQTSVWQWIGDTKLSGANNTETFYVTVTVHESVVLNGTLTATVGPDTFHTLYLDDTSSAATSGRTVTFAVAQAAVLTDTIASDTLHPVFTQRNNPCTVISGVIQGETLGATGDTLVFFSIVFSGTAKDSVTGCSLVIGPTESAHNLTKLGDSWYINTLQHAFKAPDVTSDTFRVRVWMSEWVNQSATLQAAIPINGLTTVFREQVHGPVAAASSGNTFTWRRGYLTPITMPRNIGFPSAIQVNDTKEIMWFRAQISDTVEADTIHALSINLSGPANNKFTHVYLVRDWNQNQKWDTSPSDSIVGQFAWVAGETWSINLNGLPLQTPTDTVNQETSYLSANRETSQYLIVVRISDTSAPSVRCRIPIGGADGPFTEPNAAVVQYESYNVIVPDTNPPLPPNNIMLTVNAGSLLVTFGPSPSGDTQMVNGQYNIYWDSGLLGYPDTILAAVAHVTGQQTDYSFSIPNLIPDREYRFMVKSQDQSGNQGDATAVVSAAFRALSAPAAAAGVSIYQPSAGDHVYYDTTVGARFIQLVSKLTSGTPSIVTGVNFQWRKIAGGPWHAAGTATDSTYDDLGNVFYSILFETTILPNDSTIELRGVAQTAQGGDTYAASISITTTRDTARAQFVALQSDTGRPEDTMQVEAQVTTRFGNDLVVCRTPSGAFDVVIRLLQGALNNDTDKLNAIARRDSQSETVSAAAKRAGALVPIYWVSVSLQSGQTVLGGQGAVVTVNYIDINGDGFDDSTGIDMSKAKIYTVTAAGVLEELSNIVWDKDRRTLKGTTMHFSPIFVTNGVGTGNAGLNQLIVGPNPYRPNDGLDATGKPWVAGDATSGVVFKNLPPNSKIEIYTILGEKVTQFTNGLNGPTVSWSVMNDDGRNVASGYYLYIVSDPATNQRVTGKVAVIR